MTDSSIVLIVFQFDRYNATGDQRQTDEFLKPIIINEEGLIKDGDTVVFFNYRSDRARQLSQALGERPPFETLVIPKVLSNVTIIVKLFFSFLITKVLQ